MMRLHLVPPELVADAWPLAVGYIDAGCKAGEGLTADECRRRIDADLGLLWLVMDGPRVAAALYTEFHDWSDGRRLVIEAMGGKRLSWFVHLLDELKAHAARFGCSHVVVTGRPGWRRVLAKHRPKTRWVTMDIEV